MHMFLNASEVTQANTHRANSASQIACTIRYLHSPYVVHGLLLVLCIVSMVDTLKNETSECKDVASTIIVLVFSQMANLRTSLSGH
jgi:hypothetical protein